MATWQEIETDAPELRPQRRPRPGDRRRDRLRLTRFADGVLTKGTATGRDDEEERP